MKHVAALIVLLGALALTGHAQFPSAALHGRVVADGTGAPLRNARVQATSRDQTLAPAFTDSDGRFVIPGLAGGASRLSVTKPGYLLTTISSERVRDEVEIRMPKAGAISGRITDSVGDPLIGMTVTAELARGGESDAKVIATVRTDDLGDYRLAGLPAGSFLVSVISISPMLGPDGSLLNDGGQARITTTQNGRTVTADDMRELTRVYYPGVQTTGEAQPIALSIGEERPTIDFSAPANPPIDMLGALASRAASRGGALSNATGVIRGRIVTTEGRAVLQAMVRLQSEDAPTVIPGAVTDQEGRYEFQRLIAATYKVIAMRAGFMTTEYGQRRPSDSGESIELRAGETRDAIDIALFRPGAIVGHVLDDDGEPVEGAGVQVLQIQYRDGRRRLVEAGGQGTHRTDDRGAYRIYGLRPASTSSARASARSPRTNRWSICLATRRAISPAPQIPARRSGSSSNRRGTCRRLISHWCVR